MNGACRSKYKLARPLGPSEGDKRSNIIKFQQQSQFQKFVYQTLCVILETKDMKHIKGDFCSDAWVMPKVWDLGAPRGSTFFSNMVMWHIRLTGMMSKTEYKDIFTLWSDW